MSNKLEITDTLIKTGTKADDELTEQKLNKVSGGIINYKEFNGLPILVTNCWAFKASGGTVGSC
jgi:bacteriocin-like protein